MRTVKSITSKHAQNSTRYGIVGIFLLLSATGIPQDPLPTNQDNPYAVEGESAAATVPKAVRREQERMQSEFDQDRARNSQRPTHFLDFGDGWGSKESGGKIVHFPRLWGATDSVFVHYGFYRWLAIGTGTLSLIGIPFVALNPQPDMAAIPAVVTGIGMATLSAVYLRPMLGSDYVRAAAFVRFAGRVKEETSLDSETKRQWENAQSQAEVIEKRCAHGLRSLQFLIVGTAIGAVGQLDNINRFNPNYQRIRSKYVVEPLKKALGY
jgi:hypothetical protein